MTTDPKMTPVYDVCRRDYSRDCQPIGHAKSEDEALALLTRHFQGQEEMPSGVSLDDIEVPDPAGYYTGTHGRYSLSSGFFVAAEA